MKKKRNKTGQFSERTLAELLLTLRKEELRLLTNYLKVYAKPGVFKLWQVLKAKYPHFNITDEYVRKAVNSTNPISHSSYRVQLSELSTLTKAFMTQQEFKSNTLLYANTQAKALLNRRAALNYNMVRKQHDKLFAKERKLDSEFYQYAKENKSNNFQFNLLFDPMKTGESLQLASDYHDYSFLIAKLQFLIAIRNRQRIVKKTFNEQNEKEFIDYLVKFPLDELPLIKAYYLILLLYLDGSAKNFLTFKNHLLPIRSQLDRSEVRFLLTSAMNICYWNIQDGQLEFLEERFAITKVMVEENFLQVLGYFSNNHFRTALRVAIEANQLGWAEWLLKTALPNTDPKHRTNLELLGWASLYFAKQEIEKQDKYMVQMQSEDYKFTDYYNELNYRVLKIKTDYLSLGNHPKQRAIDAFRSNIRSFQRYCNRKTNIPKSARESVVNFGLALLLLFNDRYGKIKRAENLKVTILGFRPITDLPWLLNNLSKQYWNVEDQGTCELNPSEYNPK